MKSTSGLSIWPRNCLAYADSDSTYRRWPSAKMVSKARLDLPDPDRPVNTIRASLGKSSDTSLRLCSRAPRTTRRSATTFCSPGDEGALRQTWGHAMVFGGTDRTPFPRADFPGGPAGGEHGGDNARGDTVDHEVSEWLDRLGAATARLLATSAGFTDAQVREPSLLPGWTRGHVLSHVARNADSLGNLLRGAATGAQIPMYASTQARDADIEAGAGRGAAE